MEPAAFAERLTTDLQAIAHDKHMRVAARGTPLAPPGAPTGPPPRGEGGVARADRLPGNVGYIEVVSLPPPDVFKGPLDRAMAPLKDTRALILDLRRNGGGTPAAEVYRELFRRSGEARRRQQVHVPQSGHRHVPY